MTRATSPLAKVTAAMIDPTCSVGGETKIGISELIVFKNNNGSRDNGHYEIGILGLTNDSKRSAPIPATSPTLSCLQTKERQAKYSC
jgi:hypothetical protein